MASRCAVASSVALTFFIRFGLSQATQFSNNAICRQYNCINPIFPGLEDLRRLQAVQLQCQPSLDAKQHMQFCKNAVYYDVALPSPNKTGGNATTLQSVVLQQDNAAATAYYYHLAGMNVEPWEHRQPETDGDQCTQAIWKMVCHTYFPRAEAGCKQGEPTKHLAPCKNVCSSYIQACSVECCDESVQCVAPKKASLLTTRYFDQLGPAATCTGAASRKSPGVLALIIAGLTFLQLVVPGHQSAAPTTSSGAGRKFRLPLPSWAIMRKYTLCMALFAICSTLQGCMLGEVFSHPTPSWEQVPSYWNKFQFIPEGAPAKERIYNSCEYNITKRDQCSGNGECKPWRSDLKVAAGGQPMMFCRCYRDWADPECRTRRKSQMVAYFLSVFLGFLGADHFYLASFYSGFAKLASFGGLGIWWIVDIVRIGSSPIYANEYRLAYDLPHWLYVMCTVGLFTCLGYFVFGTLTRANNFAKARSKFLRKEEELRHRALASLKYAINPEDSLGKPTFSSYAVPLPCYGAVPDVVRQSGQGNPYSPYGIFCNATQGYAGPPGMYDGRGQPRNPADFAAKANCVMHPQDHSAAMAYGY